MHNLQIENVPIGSLIEYENNSRTHSESQIEKIIASIREFGFVNPILVDKNNVIIAGHGRTMAAKKAGLDTVPCIRLNYITEEQRKALTIADNQLALNAGWDMEKLAAELQSLVDMDFEMESIGFSNGELDALLSIDSSVLPFEARSQEQHVEVEEQDEEQPKSKKEKLCPHCGMQI